MSSNCALCSEPLLGRVKPEHIWPKSLGGRMTSRNVLCDGCNSVMGSGPDRSLAESVEFIRNLMNFPDAKGKPPPTRRGLRFGGVQIALKPGAMPVASGGMPFLTNNLPDGRHYIELRISAENAEREIERVIPHLAGALGTTEEEARKVLANARFEHVTQRIGIEHQQVHLGGPEAMRITT